MEEKMFAEQIERIQSYIPFLEQMIERFQQKANSKNQQLLLKIIKIHNIVTHAEVNRPSVETLDKCEQLLRGFKRKLNNFEEKLPPRIEVDNGEKISDTQSNESIQRNHNNNEKPDTNEEVYTIPDNAESNDCAMEETHQSERQIPINETPINKDSNVDAENKNNTITTDVEIIDVDDYDKGHSSKTECLGLINFTENPKTAMDKQHLIIQNSCNVITKEDLSGILADVLNSNIATKLVEAIFSKANAKINNKVKQENVKPEIITLSDDEEDNVKTETNIEMENHTPEEIVNSNTTQENVQLDKNLQVEATVVIPQEVLDQFVPERVQMSDSNEVLVNGTANIMNSDHEFTSTATKDIENKIRNVVVPLQRCDTLRSSKTRSSHSVKPSTVQITSQEHSLETARNIGNKGVKPSPVQINSQEHSLETARNIGNKCVKPSPVQITSQEHSLETARNIGNKGIKPSPVQITSQEHSLETARNNGNKGVKPSPVQITSQEHSLETARNNGDKGVKPSPVQITSQEHSLETARNNGDKGVKPSPVQITSQEHSLETARNNGNKSVKPSPVQITSQEHSLETARNKGNKSLQKTTSVQETSNETLANDHQLDMNSKGNLEALNNLENFAAVGKVKTVQCNASENVKKTESNQNLNKTDQTHIINVKNSVSKTRKITRNLTTLVQPRINNGNGSGSVAKIETKTNIVTERKVESSTTKSDQASVDHLKVPEHLTLRKTDEVPLNANDANLRKAKKRKIDETETKTDQSITANVVPVEATNKRKSDQNDMEYQHFADSAKKRRHEQIKQTSEVREISSSENNQPQNSLLKNSVIKVNSHNMQVNVGIPSKRTSINRMSKEEIRNFKWDIKSTKPIPNRFNVKVKLKNFRFDKFMDGKVHWIIEDEKALEKAIPKNNDITMYYKSDCDKCIICLQRERLPIHYLKSHPEHEVFISRLSPVVSEKLRNNENNLPVNYQNLYKMQCQFCKRFVIGSSYVWLSHYSYHTGEHCFQCSVCKNKGMNHSKCKLCNGTKIQPITGVDAETQNIEAFMCDLCNYIQLTELSLKKHVKDQHETPETYTKVTLLDVDRTNKKMSLNCLPRQYPPKKNSVVENANEVENLEKNQELDLPTAHMPIKALEILKKDNDNKSIKKTDTTFSHKCPFCEETLCLSPQAWMGHFLIHTGESKIQCKICMRSGVEWADFTDFKDCPHMSSETFEFYRNSDVIQMYVCELCNFTQLFKRNIERHVIVKHFLEANKVSGKIVSVNLLKFEGYKHQTVVESKQGKIKGKPVAGSKTDLPETVSLLQEEPNSSSTQTIGKSQNTHFHTTSTVTKLPTTSGHCTSQGLPKSSTNDQNTKIDKGNDVTSLDTDDNKSKGAKAVSSNNNTVEGSKPDLPETVSLFGDESNLLSTQTIVKSQNTNFHTTPTVTKLSTTSGHRTSQGLPKSSTNDQNTKTDKGNVTSLDTDDNKSKGAKAVSSNNNTVEGSKTDLPETVSIVKDNKSKDSKAGSSNNNVVEGSKTDLHEIVSLVEDEPVEEEPNLSSTQTIGKSQNTNFHTTSTLTQLKFPITKITWKGYKHQTVEYKKVEIKGKPVAGSKTDLPEIVSLLEDEPVEEEPNSSSAQAIGKSQNTNFHTTLTVTQLKLPTSGHRTSQGLVKYSTNDKNMEKDKGNDVIFLDTDDNSSKGTKAVSSSSNTVEGSKTDLPEIVSLLEDESVGGESNLSSTQTIGISQNTNFHTTPTVIQSKLPTTSGHHTSQGHIKSSTNDQNTKNDQGNDVIVIDTDDNRSKGAEAVCSNNNTVDILSLRKVNHFGFSITGDKKFMYYCLCECCTFSDRHPYSVREHMNTAHPQIKWDSYCYICKGFSLPSRSYRINTEYTHMLFHLSPLEKKTDHRQYPACRIKSKMKAGPYTIDRVTNVGFTVNEKQQVIYFCLVDNCMFHSTNYSYVYAHFSTMHPNLLWDQYCEMCNRFLRFKVWSHFRSEWDHLFDKHVIRKSTAIKNLNLAERSKVNSTNNNISKITNPLNANSTDTKSNCEKPTISEKPEITNPLNANSTDTNSICEKPTISEKPPVTKPQIKIRRLPGDSLSKPISTASQEHTATISSPPTNFNPPLSPGYCTPISVPIVCQPISATADCELISTPVNFKPVTTGSTPALHTADNNIAYFQKNRQVSIIKHKPNQNNLVTLKKLIEIRPKPTPNINNSTDLANRSKYQQHCVYNGGSTIVLKKVFEPHLIENHVVVDPLTIPNFSSVQNEPNKNVVLNGNVQISSTISATPAMNKTSLDMEHNKSKLKPWVKFTCHKPDEVVQKQLNEICLYSLYKCMETTCCFSTCKADSMLKHLEEHEKTSSGKISKFECPYCSLIARTGKLLVDHITSKHSLDIYQCPYCFYRSCDQTNVLNHLNIHHISEKKCILMCHGDTKIVDLNFVTETVKAHVKPLICSKCSLNFFIISSFIDHMITTHGQTNSNVSIACGMCHKVRLSNMHTMMRHLTNVHKIARFECIYCDFLTNESNQIAPHIAHSHCSEISWICERKQNTGTDIPPVGEQTVFNATILRRFTCEKSLKIIQKCPYTIEQLNFLSNSIPDKTKSHPELITGPEKQTERLMANIREIIVRTVNTTPQSTSDRTAKPQTSTVMPNHSLKSIKLPKGFSLQILPKPQT